MSLRVPQARTGDRQMARVRLQLGVDPIELHVGEVVGLDRVRELRVDLLDLAEHVLGLGALGVDVRVGGAALTEARAAATRIAVSRRRSPGALRAFEFGGVTSWAP